MQKGYLQKYRFQEYSIKFSLVEDLEQTEIDIQLIDRAGLFLSHGKGRRTDLLR